MVFATRCNWDKDCKNLKTVIQVGDKINLSGVFQETSNRARLFQLCKSFQAEWLKRNLIFKEPIMFDYTESIISCWGDGQEKVKLPSKASTWMQARSKGRISFSRKYNTGAVQWAGILCFLEARDELSEQRATSLLYQKCTIAGAKSLHQSLLRKQPIKEIRECPP